MDTLSFSSKNLDEACTSWKIEVHDNKWPDAKVVTHEIKKLSVANNWASHTMRLRAAKKGRILAWRAQEVTKDGATWTPWYVHDVDAEKKKEVAAARQKWTDIFAAAG